ncbi:MAG: DUF4446 family protein [Agathobacter sp.]
MSLNIEELTGVSVDFIVLILLALVVVLIIINLLNNRKMKRLERRIRTFMSGKNAMSLEEAFKKKFAKLDELEAFSMENKKTMEMVLDHLDGTYQKVGLVKYNAFDDMGGKLSFTLALLNRKNDGFIINAMHSREGCYTYIKEIIDGNSVLLLAAEEREALDMALEYGNEE